MADTHDALRRGGIGEARLRFGGLDLPGAVAGMLTALATVTILGGLIAAAIGAIGYQTGIDGIEEELGIGGLVGGVLVLFLAFMFGGWAAARIARYDGKLNGVMTAVLALLLGALLAGLGTLVGNEYNVFERVDLPNLFSRDAATAAAIGSGVASALAMLLGGLLGGILGERWHRKADLTVADSGPAPVRRGGVVRETVRSESVPTRPAVDVRHDALDARATGGATSRDVDLRRDGAVREGSGRAGRIIDATPDGSLRSSDGTPVERSDDGRR